MFQRYPSMYRTSALRDTDTLLDENDLKAKQDDVNRNEYRSLWRTHYRPVAQEGEGDQTTAEIH